MGRIHLSRALSIGLSLCCPAVLALMIAFTTHAASPPQPTYGTAVVDGTISEWNLTNDFFGNMYRAFKTTQPQEARYYLRYNCATQTMYVLVQTLAGIPALEEPANAWATISGMTGKVYTGADAGNTSPPQFAWVGPFGTNTTLNETTATGYEASFHLAPGSYTIVVHVEVFDSGGAQTAGSAGSGDSLVISCPTGPDLSLTKTHSGNFTVGTNGVYTLTVANVGTGSTTGTITVTDTLPTGLGFVSGTGSGWNCSAIIQTVTCTNAGPLATSASSTITLTVGVASSAVPSVTNNATVSTTGDTNTTNDIASDATGVSLSPTPGVPSVKVLKTVSLFQDKNGNGKVNPGDILLYTITISNTGTATATGVTYNDTVDTHTSLICSGGNAPTTLQGAIASCKSGPPGGSLTVNAGDIAAGSSVTITYKVEVAKGNFNKVSNQGEATGTNFTAKKSDDPDTGTPDDPTVVSVSDPIGFIYDEGTAQIILGGKISVSGPGAVTILQDGSAGFYQFFTDGTPGVYTITLTLPPNYSMSTKCLPKDPPPFDPTGGPNPTILGNSENGATGFLTSNACTAYYFTFDLAPGDPDIQDNNFPVKKSVIPLVGGDPPIYKNIVVFPTPEWALGRDLNGDGDTSDTAMRYKNLITGEVVNTGIPVSGMPRAVDIYEDTIVFVLQEVSLRNFTGTFNLGSSFSFSDGPIGTYNLRTGKVRLTGVWGSRPTIYKNIISISGNTVRYYDLNTGKLTDTGIPGQNQALWGRLIAYQSQESPDGPPLIHILNLDTGAVINTGVPGSSPAIHDHIIAFTTSEAWVAQDLNGDGDKNDTVIRFYDLSSQTVFDTAEEGEDPAIYGSRIVFSSGNHIRYFDRKSGHAFDTGQVGAEPDIYEDTITYYVWENLKGADGDGDRLAPIVKTHQISESDRLLPKKATSLQMITLSSAPATLSITRVLNTQQAHAIRFEVQGVGVASIQVEVYDLRGKRVFDSGFAPGRTLTWDLVAQNGRLVANGVYLYVVNVRGADGTVVRGQIQKLVVLR